MGFDNECILNIQSLPGEYFCPVCRTLIYPNEALQSQCTHLYCKPCLAYIVATSQACPYDGYLVTEADSKPMLESNKALAETIGKVAVHCLYYRSGCQWQGTLLDCTTHCTDCAFGNSLVVCNRCGTQIIHRQVQEHAQTCPGLQPQGQHAGNSQAQASTASNQAATQDSSTAASAAAASSTSAAAASIAGTTSAPAILATVPAATGQVQSHGNTTAQPQTTAQASTAEQWYQQQQLQYQQYYQQYAGYNPYQQQYQQYAQYQQQVYQQYPQAYMQVPAQHAYHGQQQPLPFMVPQSQTQPQTLQQPQPQPQAQPQPHLQSQPQAQALVPQQHVPQPQPQPQHQSQLQPQMQPQPQSQTQPQIQPQPQPQPQPQAQSQPQPQPQAQSQPQPQPQPHSHANPPQMQAQQVHASAQQPHPQMQPQSYPPLHAQVPGQQPVQQHLQPHISQYQPHSQAPPPHQAAPQPHQQQPHPQMQSLHTHAQHQPPPQHQPQAQAHILPQPQHQQPHMQSQTRPQPHPLPLQQPQHPSAQGVSGYHSYQQSQPFQQPDPNVQQHPIQVHPQHQGPPLQRPQQPGQIQNQFPPQQPPQMRPPHTQLPVQSQQQPVMVQSQGSRPSHQQTPQPVLQPGQPVPHNTSMHPPAQQQALPQQQMHGSVPPSHPYHQGAFKHAMPQPQSLRLQHVPSQHQPHLPQNVPSAQGMPAHQAQAMAGKPMIASQAMPQQAFQQTPASSAMLMQSGMNQQQVQLPRSSSQGSLVPESSGPSSRAEVNQVSAAQAISKPEVSGSQGIVPEKAGRMPELEASTATKIGNVSEVSNSVSAKMKPSKHEADSETIGDEEKATQIAKKQAVQADTESAQVSGKGPGSMLKDDTVEEPQVKPTIEGESRETQDAEGAGPHPKAAVDNKETETQDDENSAKSDRHVEGVVGHAVSVGTGIVNPPLGSNQIPQREPLGSTSEKSDRHFFIQSEGKGNMLHMQTPQQMPGPTGLVRVQFQQQAHPNAVPDHGTPLAQPGRHDRSWQGLGPDEVRLMPSAGPNLGQDRFPPSHIPYGNSSTNPGPTMVLQRPLASDRMFPQQMPHSQERRFQEPPVHQMPSHGQALPPNQMRPPGRNFPEGLPHQGQVSVVQEPFQPPQGKHPPGLSQNEVFHAGMPGQGLPHPAGISPGPSGLPPLSFEQQAMAPQGHSQSHMPPSRDGGERFPQVGPVPPLAMGGPPLGGFNGPSGTVARGPVLGPEYRATLPRPPNPVEAESYANRRPDDFDGWRPELRETTADHIPHGPPMDSQSNMMKMNGFPGKGPHGGMHDSVVPHGLMEERFRPLQDERFKLSSEEGFREAQEERIRPSVLDPGWRTTSQREFEEDFKQFPRPAHLDGRAIHKFEAHVSSSRPVGLDPLPRSRDRTLFGTDGPSTPNSRPLPSYQSGGPFPVSSGSTAAFVPDGIGNGQKLFGLQDNLGRNRDLIDARLDHPRPASESGRHHLDSLPPPRSPGREYTGPSFGKFASVGQSRVEDFDGRDPHGFGERLRTFNVPLDAPGGAFNESRVPKHLIPGSGILPPHLRRGDPDSPDSLRRNGLDVLPRHLRADEPFVHGFSSNPRSGEAPGARNLPSLLQGGDPLGQGQLQMGEPTGFGGIHRYSRAGLGSLSSHFSVGESVGGGNLPGHMHGSELGFGSRYHVHGVSLGDMDSLEYSRKRKPGSMGWCRICKIDCETVEGLDQHSQTREHQRMAMDMVLSIKKENAKKLKLTSGDSFSLEDTIKSKKTNFENRENRQ